MRITWPNGNFLIKKIPNGTLCKISLKTGLPPLQQLLPITAQCPTLLLPSKRASSLTKSSEQQFVQARHGVTE